MPAPRRVSHPPYVQFVAPTAWTTLSVTLHADGRVEHRLEGASPFPRHWLYDEGRLVAKSAVVDYRTWSLEAFGVLEVEVDGSVVAEVAPGAVLGERALLESGSRTSTLRAVTRRAVAVASADVLDARALVTLSAGHRREHE